MRMKFLGLVLVSVAAVMFANGCGDKNTTTAAGKARCTLKADAADSLRKACGLQTVSTDATKKCEAVLGCGQSTDAYGGPACKFDDQKVKSGDCEKFTVQADCEKFGGLVPVCEYK